MLKVIGVGDNVCDIYLHQGEMYPGGQALNFSVYCKKAGHQAAYMGVFGNDEVAAHVRRVLEKLKVETSHCRHVAGENGYAVVDLVNGDRVFVTSNKSGVLHTNPLILAEEDLQYLSGFELIHTSNNSYFDSQLEKLETLSALVSYDFSGSWTDDSRTKSICPFIDFAFLSCSGMEEEQVEALAVRLYTWGAKLVIATRGEKGALLYDGTQCYYQVPRLVRAVDTLGAGDSFAAGFLMYYMEHRSPPGGAPAPGERAHILQEALDSGAELAAKTCLVHGAFGYAAPIPRVHPCQTLNCKR